MSREDLINFVNAVEHSYALREELNHSKDLNSILNLAAKYGFKITKKDLSEESDAERIESWFKTNIISPIKRL
jgi:predicted ribosomally synthesized peptide with nif11-like leader